MLLPLIWPVRGSWPTLSLLILIAAAPLVLAPAARAAASPNHEPKIAFNKTSETVADVAGGDLANYSFEVKNEGSADLQITGIQPSCGCTVASCAPVVHPGASTVIKAVMHTQALWGTTTKSLTVYSNDPVQPVVNLSIIAIVVPALSVTPKELITVPYDDPAPITRTFTIVSHRKDPMKPHIPPATSGPVKVQVDSDPKSPESCRVTMTLTPPASGGDAVGVTELTTGLSDVPTIRLTLVAVGQKGIAMSPAMLDLGLVDTTDKSEGSISLFSRKSTFHITGAESDNPRLSVSYKSLPQSTSWYSVTVTYLGGWKRGLHQGTITIHTDLPGFAEVKAPYWAAVQ